MPVVTKVDVPSSSLLQATLASAGFHDAYEAPLGNSAATPTEIFLHAIRGTPPWVGYLMSLRNQIVRQLGLKDVGAMHGEAGKPAGDYQIGDRLGIFTIFDKTANELVLGIDDRHLDVRVSVFKPGTERPERYVVSTVVKVHNWLGQVYMVPVGRIHPFVVRAMMRRSTV